MGLLTKLVLEREGHYVEHVTDGQQAWDRVQADPVFFDLVITDHQMPRLTGLELVTRLRRAKYRGKIIVHSSSVGAKEEQAYRALGVETFLQKPANLQQLLAALRWC